MLHRAASLSHVDRMDIETQLLKTQLWCWKKPRVTAVYPTTSSGQTALKMAQTFLVWYTTLYATAASTRRSRTRKQTAYQETPDIGPSDPTNRGFLEMLWYFRTTAGTVTLVFTILRIAQTTCIRPQTAKACVRETRPGFLEAGKMPISIE